MNKKNTWHFCCNFLNIFFLKTFSRKHTHQNRHADKIQLSIFRILRPGAIWVNLGPLLYHYSDVSGEGSIEPSYEDLLMIIRGCGFQILVSLISHSKFISYQPLFPMIFFRIFRKMRRELKRNMLRIHDQCNKVNIWAYFLYVKSQF